MTKRNIKLFSVLLTVILVTSMSIFYACKKDEKDSDSEKKSTKEADFIAKNHDETCVHVGVFRDENNNAQFFIKEVANDPTIKIGLIIPDALNIKLQQTRDAVSLVYEIPNDGIYWLVPFDGNKPVKFEPIKGNGEKNVVGGGNYAKISCDCWEWIVDGTPYSCKLKGTDCESGGSCTWCRKFTSAMIVSLNGDSTTTVFAGSTYIVKSESIEINGTIYE